MEEYGPVTYGERMADVYDERIARMGIPKDEAVELLAELTQELGAGSVLELAIGTGRIALPLEERDVEVHGVDISDAMVAKLREKPAARTSRSRWGTSPTFRPTAATD
jgi:ubiquinone/menaquinone biosynthesis C-methylase UbiE